MTEPEEIAEPASPLLEVPPPSRDGDGAWMLAPRGEIDMSSSPQLASATLPVTRVPGSNLVIDLADVTHLDSSGIGVLLETMRQLESSGGSLRITNPSGIVARVLEISGALPLLGDGQS